MTMDTVLGLALYRAMRRIRLVEEGVAARYGAGRMRCPTHLSIGQEAVPAAWGACVRPTDPAVSTHRAHAHYLAKGGDLRAMLAEIHGKDAGCCRGKGGSMHLADPAVGFVGSSAIVGNSIPVGVGLALAARVKGTDQVSSIFLGDGAVEEGVFYESVNFAALRRLPVLFLCENNLYSVYTPLGDRQPPGRVIADMVRGLGVASERVDGNDALACHAAIARAVAAARAGDGPRFLEFATYRWREHCGPNFDNALGYRTQEEFQAWQARDPIPRLAGPLLEADPGLGPVLAEMDRELAAEIDAAFAFAEEAPFPEPRAAYQGVYATE